GGFYTHVLAIQPGGVIDHGAVQCVGHTVYVALERRDDEFPIGKQRSRPHIDVAIQARIALHDHARRLELLKVHHGPQVPSRLQVEVSGNGQFVERSRPAYAHHARVIDVGLVQRGVAQRAGGGVVRRACNAAGTVGAFDIAQYRAGVVDSQRGRVGGGAGQPGAVAPQRGAVMIHGRTSGPSNDFAGSVHVQCVLPAADQPHRITIRPRTAGDCAADVHGDSARPLRAGALSKNAGRVFALRTDTTGLIDRYIVAVARTADGRRTARKAAFGTAAQASAAADGLRDDAEGIDAGCPDVAVRVHGNDTTVAVAANFTAIVRSGGPVVHAQLYAHGCIARDSAASADGLRNEGVRSSAMRRQHTARVQAQSKRAAISCRAAAPAQGDTAQVAGRASATHTPAAAYGLRQQAMGAIAVGLDVDTQGHIDRPAVARRAALAAYRRRASLDGCVQPPRRAGDTA